MPGYYVRVNFSVHTWCSSTGSDPSSTIDRHECEHPVFSRTHPRIRARCPCSSTRSKPCTQALKWVFISWVSSVWKDMSANLLRYLQWFLHSLLVAFQAVAELRWSDPPLFQNFLLAAVPENNRSLENDMKTPVAIGSFDTWLRKNPSFVRVVLKSVRRSFVN